MQLLINTFHNLVDVLLLFLVELQLLLLELQLLLKRFLIFAV